jgi:acyl carrier protein
VRFQTAHEKELLVAPELWGALGHHLPRLAGAEIGLQLKGGRAHNELTQFRYDVVLHLAGDPGEEPPAAPAARWLDWQRDELSVTELRRLLAEERPPALGVFCVPNARLQEAWLARELLTEESGLATVGELRSALAEARERQPGIEPADLWDLAEEFPYRVDLFWSPHGGNGRFDALFQAQETARVTPGLAPRQVPAGPWSQWANNPLRGLSAEKLVPHLRGFLTERLPEYMVPAVFVHLESMPLTASGKIDRKALPAPDWKPQAAHVAPRTPVEEKLAAIWAEVLEIDRVSVHDNFFEIGGHSLLVTQVVSRLRGGLGVEIPLRTVFEVPTVAGLAERIEAVLWARDAAREPVGVGAGEEEGEL